MSGIQLTPAYAEFDAERRFTPAPQQVADNPQSRCGDVLTGRCKPSDCPLFGKKLYTRNGIRCLNGVIRRCMCGLLSVSP